MKRTSDILVTLSLFVCVLVTSPAEICQAFLLDFFARQERAMQFFSNPCLTNHTWSGINILDKLCYFTKNCSSLNPVTNILLTLYLFRLHRLKIYDNKPIAYPVLF